MDPVALQTLSTQLLDVAARNTATNVIDRVTAARARKKENETIAELEEIVSGLIADKSELVQISQAFEQELVAQRIAPADIEFISTSIIPVIEQVVGLVGAGGDDGSAKRAIELLKPLLAVESVTILQLIGFNIRKAIGEPLTEITSQAILARANQGTTGAPQAQKGRPSGGSRR